MKEITLTQPDDFHLHLRDGEILSLLVPHTARQFARAIIMPNLNKPIINVSQAMLYKQRILKAVPSKLKFEPLMTLYLTDNLSCAEIENAAQNNAIHAIKYYPSGATTNSESGVSDIKNVYPVLECMQKYKLPLLLHGEVTHPDVDIFDREAVFIEQILHPLKMNFPELKIVFEHITTSQAKQYVWDADEYLAATITPQHLLYNRNEIFKSGIRPHYYCLPILKKESHRQALIEAATSGHPRFFLGTDSAPHLRHAKESSCGCAGMYSAANALELYASVFDNHHALDMLEKFASVHGAHFYGLKLNTNKIKLIKKPWTVPDSYQYIDDEIIPIAAGETLQWQLEELT